MYKKLNTLATPDQLEHAAKIVYNSPLGIIKTPLILAKSAETNSGEKQQPRDMLSSVDSCKLLKPLPSTTQLLLKCENMQKMGSFKIRGIANQMVKAEKLLSENPERRLVTISAGNYGRSFAYAVSQLGMKGTVILPETAPVNRTQSIESYGLQVERKPTEKLLEAVAEHESRGSLYFHPNDDMALITGYATVAREMLDQCQGSVPDIVLVSCGGGGLLAGVAAGLRAWGPPGIRIYGVEPEHACGMYHSVVDGAAKEEVPWPRYSVASGLSPPFAGHNAYNHVRELCQGVILVTDDEIVECVQLCYRHGLVVEPSGAAALTAVLSGRLAELEADLSHKTVGVVLTGGNIAVDELAFKDRKRFETGNKAMVVKTEKY